MANIVYIATSLDGYIADENNGVDWLHEVDNPDNSDLGFSEHMARIDALIMGRNTFELVASFEGEGEWPYSKPVFVLSNSLEQLPTGFQDKASLIQGDIKDIVTNLNHAGFNNLYIDGGVTIQNFLKEDLIDEMVITTIPVLLGGGIPLFSRLTNKLKFHCVKSELLLKSLVKNTFVRER